jgi:hypothetical protein
VVTGNCCDHRENLSKLKDADFQQLTIKLFYLITRQGFNRKELSLYSAKFLSKMGLKKLTFRLIVYNAMVKNLTQIKVVPFFAGKWYQFRPALKGTETI